MEKQESKRGAIEEVRLELARQESEIETFFADLALRLLIDRPKSASGEELDEHRQFWNGIFECVERLVQVAPDLRRRMKTSAAQEATAHKAKPPTASKPKVIYFYEDEADVRKQLADIGYLAIGPLFLYRSRESRDKVEQLIERKSPGWALTLGRALAAGAALHLVSAGMRRLGDESPSSELKLLAERLKAEIRELQDDDLGRDARGRRIGDWTTTMHENGVIYQALFGMVSNRAGTALKALLDDAGFQDIDVDGRMPKEEFAAADWAELRKDLGLDEMGPYRKLLASPQGDRLLQAVSETTSEDVSKQIESIVDSVFGPKAGVNGDACALVFRAIHKRLSRFNHQWFRLRRHEQMLLQSQAETKVTKRGPKLSEDEDGDDSDIDMSELFTPAGRDKSSTSGDSNGKDGAAGACHDKAGGQEAAPPSDGSPDEVADEATLGHVQSDELEDDCEQAIDVDDRRFLSAFRSATCATQLLVYMKRANLAKVPIGNGDDWSEKGIVYAATIDALYWIFKCNACSEEPASSAITLCKRLFNLSVQSPTNKGFAVFAPTHERGRFLYQMVLDLAQSWRFCRRDTADLQAFELNYQGPGHMALTKGDRDDLERVFDRARRECEASVELRICLGNHLGVDVSNQSRVKSATRKIRRAVGVSRLHDEKGGRHHG